MPLPFYKALQKNVDSENKAQEKKKRKGDKTELEYFPLIENVRIYAKSDTLSTGAVLVDLPSV